MHLLKSFFTLPEHPVSHQVCKGGHWISRSRGLSSAYGLVARVRRSRHGDRSAYRGGWSYGRRYRSLTKAGVRTPACKEALTGSTAAMVCSAPWRGR